jgi:hypothetical protein
MTGLAPGLLCVSIRPLQQCSSLDSLALLTRQLVEISELAEQLRANLGRPGAARLHRELCNCATLHVLARERFLLPAWARAGYKDLRLDTLAPHVEFKRHLAELMVAKPSEAASFQAVLEAFVIAARTQREVDEKLLVPALQRTVDLAERRFVMNDIDHLYGLVGRSVADLDEATLTGAGLLEDARIVLRSLPGAVDQGVAEG